MSRITESQDKNTSPSMKKLLGLLSKAEARFRVEFPWPTSAGVQLDEEAGCPRAGQAWISLRFQADLGFYLEEVKDGTRLWSPPMTEDQIAKIIPRLPDLWKACVAARGTSELEIQAACEELEAWLNQRDPTWKARKS